ncbi:MAG: CAP domain-containing protein [Pseudomonadota bacterium]|nr:CAP domain-containing protein [Pseudomonadota bacterium]
MLWSRRAALLAPLGLAACATEIVEPPPPSRAKLDAVRLDPAEALGWLNAYRAQSGLAPVRLDAELTALAQAQADAMASADKISHDVQGAFAARLAASGVRAGEAGENVCAGYFSTVQAMQAWRRSPEHDVNLRLRSATRFGVALAKNPRSGWGAFWAMAIASPPPG